MEIIKKLNGCQVVTDGIKYCPTPMSTPPDPDHWHCPLCLTSLCDLDLHHGIDSESVEALQRFVENGDVHAVRRWLRSVDWCDVPDGDTLSRGREIGQRWIANTVSKLRGIADHIEEFLK